MLKLSLNNSHETVKGVRCNCFSKSDHQFRESPFSWKMAILDLELEVYSFNVKHLFIPSSHASACLLGHPPKKSRILIFWISLEISKRGSFLESCALSKFSHLTYVVLTSTRFSNFLFKVTIMVSKDLSMTFISWVGAFLGGTGGDGYQPRPHYRPRLVRILTMIDHVSWKQHHIISF